MPPPRCAPDKVRAPLTNYCNLHPVSSRLFSYRDRDRPAHAIDPIASEPKLAWALPDLIRDRETHGPKDGRLRGGDPTFDDIELREQRVRGQREGEMFRTLRQLRTLRCYLRTPRCLQRDIRVFGGKRCIASMAGLLKRPVKIALVQLASGLSSLPLPSHLPHHFYTFE
jgi:hypothetical protein